MKNRCENISNCCDNQLKEQDVYKFFIVRKKNKIEWIDSDFKARYWILYGRILILFHNATQFHDVRQHLLFKLIN